MARDRRVHKRTILLTALGLVGIVVIVAVIYKVALDRETAAREAIQMQEMLARQTTDNTKYVEWNGVTYKPRGNLTTILFMGVDMTSEDLAKVMGYRGHGQTDFVMLAVVDHDAKTVSRLQIDRDTMLEIETLGLFGHEAGMMTDHLSVQHHYGDGKEQSCGMVVRAVSRLLMGVPIEHYIALSLDSIPKVNDAVGGVTVTLEDDFSRFDPEWTLGSTVTMHGDQTAWFVRSRMTVGDGSNASRMNRQNQFLDKLAVMVKDKIKETPAFVGTLFNTLGASLVTDMTRGRIINEANRALDYQVLAMDQLPGEHIVSGYGFVEFYPQQSAIEQWVMDTFCSPVEGGGQTYQ
ncbi:hypothetical protein AGMMS49992_05390 [Clostridia bacterium]|nr:hypothetical protein AGMMS49992_05390 [Clostridia bacterium]